MEQYNSNCHPRIVYPVKLSFNLDGEIGTFQDKGKLQWFMSTKPIVHLVIIHREQDETQSQIWENRKEKSLKEELMNLQELGN
jgi:hypothetical protein